MFSVSEDFCCMTQTSIYHPENRRHPSMGAYTVMAGWARVTPLRKSYEAFFFGQRQRQAGFFGPRCSRLLRLLCTGPVRSLHPPLLPDDTQQQQQSQAEQGQHGGHQHRHCRWDQCLHRNGDGQLGREPHTDKAVMVNRCKIRCLLQIKKHNLELLSRCTTGKLNRQHF